jgi:hypothetical protein
MSLRTVVIAVTIAMLSAGCGGDDEPPRAAAPQDEASFPPAMSPYEPVIDPADFVEGIDNPYLPFEPGTTYVYEVVAEGERERDVITVTNRTKEVMGVTTTVVRDQVFVAGELAEDTFDWFAQDRQGNVWYLGEDTKEYEKGKVVSTEGSWEAGVDGALPGIIMLGDPKIGSSYRQEYYPGHAEDFGTVVAIGKQVTVPYGTFNDCLEIRDWSALSSDREAKFFCPEVGFLVLEVESDTSKSALVDVR